MFYVISKLFLWRTQLTDWLNHWFSWTGYIAILARTSEDQTLRAIKCQLCTAAYSVVQHPVKLIAARSTLFTNEITPVPSNILHFSSVQSILASNKITLNCIFWIHIYPGFYALCKGTRWKLVLHTTEQMVGLVVMSPADGRTNSRNKSAEYVSANLKIMTIKKY